MEQQPKKKTNVGLIIGIVAGAILACVAFVLVLVFVVLKATGPAADVAESFMTALKDKDYAAAYGLCTGDLQDELGSVGSLREAIEEAGANPVSWNLNSRNVENDQAVIAGDGVFTQGREAKVEIVLLKVGDGWKVAGFHFTWK